MKKILLGVFIFILAFMIGGCDNDIDNDLNNIIEDTSTYTLTIVVEGEGTVEPSEGKYEYDEDTIIDLKASPAENYEFSHWEGEVTNSGSTETTAVLDEDKEIIVHFVEFTSNLIPEGMALVEAGVTSSDNGSVSVKYDYYIGKYHVTQAEFKNVMEFNPSYFSGDNKPVELVSWYDAVMYCNKLSEREGLSKYYNISNIKYDGNNILDAIVTENKESNGYRLPTEDEHEYAARGGRDGDVTLYAGSNNLEEVGWYQGNTNETMPVGEKEANELGLYDMSGNVYDWTNTNSDSYRILRGGYWDGSADRCKVSHSLRAVYPGNRGRVTGFRLARNF